MKNCKSKKKSGSSASHHSGIIQLIQKYYDYFHTANRAFLYSTMISTLNVLSGGMPSSHERT